MRKLFSRSRWWLLAPLVLLIALYATHVYALGDGEVDTSGSVTGTGTQSWTFYAPSGTTTYMKAGIGASSPSTEFEPSIHVYNPDSSYNFGAAGGEDSYGVLDGSAALTQSGTYTIKGFNNIGNDYPSYHGYFQMNIAVPGQTDYSSHGSGGLLYQGVSNSGSLAYANTDIWTFSANSGDTVTLTLTPGGGWVGYSDIHLYGPDSSYIGGKQTTGSDAYSQAISTTGNYMAFVNNEVSGSTDVSPPASYAMEMTNSTALSPTPETDGSPCCSGETQQPDSAQNSEVVANGAASIAEPINIATGNMYLDVVDYTTVGTNPLAFIRSYNSKSVQHGLYATALGPNWRSNYDRYLRYVSSSLVAVERPDGRVINFKLVSSVWTPDTDFDFKLTNSGSTYTLTTPDDTVEVYTVASGKGTLNSITKANGYAQTLTYTSGNLTSVSDSYSRTLTLSYTSGTLTGVSTPDSATLTYGYTTVSSQSLLTSVTYNTTTSTSQTYVYGNAEFPFALTSITDEDGNTNSQWTYDGEGRCTMSENAGGANEFQVSYDDSTGNRTVTGPLGNVEKYEFTTLQGKSKVSSIVRTANSPVAAATRNFTYDANGFLATATDWDGNSTHWTNNSHGQPTSITEAYGSGVARTTTITYDSTWVHKPYTITKTNVTEDDRYNASTGTLTSRTLTDTTGGTTNGDTEVWAYTYDATGEMLTETFPRTGTTVKNTYTYSSGALASITDQLSHSVTISTANGTGQPTKMLDANSVETDFVYDNRNRLTSKTVKATPSNEVTTISYIGSGQTHVVTLPDSSTITYAYDNAQRLTTVTNTAGETINYTLNAMGKPTTVAIKDSGGTTRNSWTATYDVLGDMLTRVGAGGAGQKTTYTYDGMMNRLSVEDANSKTTSTAFDALNRPSTVTDANSNTAAPTYNNLDYVTAQTDFNGYSTSDTRDAFGNAIARSSPDSGSWSYTFDEDNNLKTITDARSVATTNTFDAVDRLTGISISGYSSEAESFTYDSTSGGNIGVARLTSWSDESGSGSRVYDNFGNITSTAQTIGSNNYTTSYSYDLANRVTEIIYPSGRYVDYTYDSSGYLTTVTTKPSSGGTVTTLASSITHKPFGPITGLTYGNSEALTRSYDNNYWLTAINTVYSGTYVQELSYTQDNAGNYTAITDTLDSTRDESFGVDSLNRLHTASGKYGSRTYTYDNNGNRSTRVYGGTTQTSTLTSSTNLLASITDGTNTRHFTNSANGNVLTDDRAMDGGVAVSNTYGGRDRLESQTVGTPTITFKINALGQRVQKATTGATTDYHYDLTGHLIGEANDSTGANLREYVYIEGEPLAQIDSSGNIFYLHNSQVGAPQKLTDASRTLVFDQIIEPFGEVYSTPTNTDPTNIQFPGQYADAENLLSYNMARNYDTTLGRFGEADPLGFGGGYNLYGYAGQNPVIKIDPTGQDAGVITLPTAGACVLNPACYAAVIGAGAVGGGYLAGVGVAKVITYVRKQCSNDNGPCDVAQKSLERQKPIIQSILSNTSLPQARVIQQYNLAVSGFNSNVAAHNLTCPNNQVQPLPTLSAGPTQ